MPSNNDWKVKFKKGFKSGLKQQALNYISNNKYYQRSIGDFNAIKTQLANPWNKVGWYDLYNRSKQSRNFQRGLFNKLTGGEPSTPKKRRAVDALPSPPPTKKSKTTRSSNRLNTDMAKYSKKTKGKRRKGGQRKRQTKKRSKRGSKYITMQSNKTMVSLAYKKPKNANVIKETRSLATLVRRTGNWQTAAPGRQEVTNLYSSDVAPMGRGDLLELYETGAKFFNATTNTWITSEAKAPAIGDRAGKKLYIDSCHQTYDLTNQGPTSLYFKMYFVLPKRTAVDEYDPSTVWNAGLDYEQGDESTSAFNKYVHAKPTDCKLFNENFTIVKCIGGKMDPGDERKIVFNYKPKRFLDINYSWENKTIRGLGPLQVMLVTHGVVADDNNSNTGGNITTTRTKIVVTGCFRYRGYVCEQRGRYTKDIGTPYVTKTIGVGNVFSIADANGNVVDSNLATNFA